MVHKSYEKNNKYWIQVDGTQELREKQQVLNINWLKIMTVHECYKESAQVKCDKVVKNTAWNSGNTSTRCLEDSPYVSIGMDTF